MANKKTQVGELALEYLSKMQDKDTRTIARKLRKDHPLVFRSVEAARTTVRYYRGRQGVTSRNNLTTRCFVLPTPTPDNPFSLPETREKEWVPYVLAPSSKKNAVIADWHIPYHNMEACNIMLTAMKFYGPDSIVLDGDMFDCYSLSSFTKDPEERDFPREKRAMRHFLMALRNQFPNARIVYKRGNHEMRFQSILMKQASDLYDKDETRLDVLLGLPDLDIEWVTDKRILKIGMLNILHGHEWTGGATASVNPARTAFLKGKACCLVAHNHQTSQHTEPTLEGKNITTWSIGCGSELHPQYMPINKWNHGMAFVEQGSDGDFMVESKRIIKGELV